MVTKLIKINKKINNKLIINKWIRDVENLSNFYNYCYYVKDKETEGNYVYG